MSLKLILMQRPLARLLYANYSRLTPVLVAAIQEQQEIIKTLQDQLDNQDEKFKKQDQQYAELKAEIMKMQGLAKK